MASNKSNRLEQSLNDELHPFAVRQSTPLPATSAKSEHVSKETRKQVGTETSGQVSKDTNKQEDEPAYFYVSEETMKQGNKPTNIKRYSTYLNRDAIKAVRRIAFESDRKDYEIVQDAIDEYLKRRG